MKKWNKYSTLFFLAGCFFIAQAVYSQKEVDSIIKEANKQIYENPELAIELAQKAYNNPEVTVRNKINILLAISTAYSSKRDYGKSSEYVEQIKELLPKINDVRQKMNILNRIAGHYQELQIYDKALEYLDESLVLIEKYPQKDSIQSFLGYNATLRGFIYREQMNCDIALTYFNKAIEAYKKTLERHLMNANLSICYYNKGNCLLSLGKNEEAEASYLKSIAHAETIEAKSLIAFGQKGLAEAKTMEGNYNEAISLLKDASTISESVGDLILNQGLYEGLSNNYLAIHDYDHYTIFHNKFITLQEENKKSERKTVNQSLINLTEGKAKEIEQLKTHYGPIQICLLIVVLASLILLLRFVFFEEKKLKKLQEKLKN
ncbi:MAG: tetratricopeptide repeat protein [Aequorivita sp.]|nr:tetratricopeptide repeat protein [Aequorivita sp.]